MLFLMPSFTLISDFYEDDNDDDDGSAIPKS